MKEFFKSAFAKIIGFVALLLVGVMIYSATTGGLATLPAKLTGLFVTPFQTAGGWISDGFSNMVDKITGTRGLSGRIEELEKENAELRNQLIEYNELKQKNEWYSDILGLHEQHSDYTFAAGRVIGRDPADAYSNFTISAGQNAGIAVNDPVVATDGTLVGVVREVGLTYAKVRTVLDPSTKVASQISSTGDTAYTAGSSVELARQNILNLTTLERSSGVAVGDYVVTSGIGGVYPEGLILGTVQTVKNASDGMTLNAEVKLIAKIHDLKQVMVITSFDGQGSR